MGQYWSRLFRGNKQYRILLIGLESSGKSSILYELKLGEVVSTIPIIGFCIESVVYKKITLDSFGVGGRSHNRPLMKYFLEGTDAVIFTVNSHYADMFPEAKCELDYALAHETLANCPVLILANKQDLPQANSVEMVTRALDLDSLKQDWAIYPSSSYDKKGLMKAFDWLHARLETRDLKATCVTPVLETIVDVENTVTKSKTNLTEFFKKPLWDLKLWLSKP